MRNWTERHIVELIDRYGAGRKNEKLVRKTYIRADKKASRDIRVKMDDNDRDIF